jgi:hypothetical protein
MMTSNRVRLLIFGLLAFSQAGCLVLAGTAAVGGGAAGYAYVKGKVSQTFTAPMDKAEAASEAALQDLGLPYSKPRIGSTHSQIDANTSLGEAILIDLDQEKDQVRISVRVGSFGDQTLSHRILDQVEKRLNSSESLPQGNSPFIPPAGVKQASHETTEPPLAN